MSANGTSALFEFRTAAAASKTAWPFSALGSDAIAINSRSVAARRRLRTRSAVSVVSRTNLRVHVQRDWSESEAELARLCAPCAAIAACKPYTEIVADNAPMLLCMAAHSNYALIMESRDSRKQTRYRRLAVS